MYIFWCGGVPGSFRWTQVLLLVVIIIIPVALSGGERAEVIITGQNPLFSGRGRRCSGRREDNSNLDNTGTKRVYRGSILPFVDQVVVKFEADDDGGTL